MVFVIIFICIAVGVWLVSFIIEGLRPVPETPKVLGWAPGVEIRYVDVGDYKLRYIKTGEGPNLLLLHTLRTQLDFFEKVIPGLAKRFTVYALDYPGHGYSDIPKATYDANFFVSSVEKFLNALDLKNVILSGVSIGGSIALIIAERQNPRVERVVAINPYGYAKGQGMARSSFLGWMISTTSQIPVLGETIMRLRSFVIMRAVLNGGVVNAKNIPAWLSKEMYEVGNRPGHYRAFLSLLRNAESFEKAAEEYKNIKLPVKLIWGEKDWSTAQEREHDQSLLKNATIITIPNAGHFLPLDRPDAIIEEFKTLEKRV